MGRFRSFAARAIKPAAMVGAVGILSLGLVVTTPSNAQAFVEYDKIQPTATRVFGAVKTVAPAAMAVASFTPVGFGLRLAFLAFSTADLWMPLFTGTFGTPNANANVQAGSQVTIVPGMRMSGGTIANNTFSGTTQNTSTTTNDVYVMREASCRNNSTGVVRGASSLSGARLSQGQVLPINYAPCNVGETLVGARAAAECALYTCTAGYVGKPGPENQASAGTLTPGGFDPRGSNVGYQGRSECIDPNGTISWVEGPTTPGNNDGGTMLMPSCEKAGKGHGTGRTQVKGFKPDGTTETVWDTGTNPLMDPATPLCDPGRATSGCLMEVTKDGQPCKTGDVECENWASESKKEGNTRYGCKLGPYTLPASACSLLEQAYMPGGGLLNEPNTDGNPDTRSPLGPSGQPAPAPAPVTNGTPGISPAPGVSGQPGPGAEESARQCWPTGWGMFNPMEWVLKPLRCAFEPTKDVSMIGQIFRQKAEMKAPVSFLNLELIGPGSAGCPNWVINVPGFTQNIVCGSSFTAAILSIRTPLFAILATAMVWPLIRSLWYAAIPILRVTPSSGGK